MSIIDQIQNEMLKLREMDKRPNSINLTVDEGFQFLDEISKSNATTFFGSDLDSIVIKRDVDELMRMSGNLNYYGITVYFRKMVD